jgi:superfamily II DNA or RNA helicase
MEISFKNVGLGRTRLFTEDEIAFDQIRDKFSDNVTNFQYIKRCKSRGYRPDPTRVSNHVYAINRSGEFNTGLLDDILDFIKNNFYNRTVDLTFDEKTKDYLQTNDAPLKTKSIIVDKAGSKPRQYQIDSMQLALNKQNGVFILGTGAGKTLCTALLSHNLLKNKLAKKVLIICPFPQLARQTADEISKNLSKFLTKIQYWGADSKADLGISRGIVVCSSTFLRSRFDEVRDQICSFDALIVDEVQQLKETSAITSIVSQLPAKFRYGFTGTLPDGKIDILTVKGLIGPVRYKLSSAELRADSYLTPIKAIGLRTNVKSYVPAKDDRTKFGSDLYNEEVEALSENDEFNNIVATVAGNFKNNTLILISRLSQGEKLEELCKAKFPNKIVHYINGSVALEDRTDIVEEMEKSNDLILIAQVATFSVGINVKNIHNIVFPGMIGKSTVRIVQSIGRGLRLNNNKSQLNLIDIIPNTKYCLRHNEKRKEIYENEKIPYVERQLNS